jgi:hypothetical protein
MITEIERLAKNLREKKQQLYNGWLLCKCGERRHVTTPEENCPFCKLKDATQECYNMIEEDSGKSPAIFGEMLRVIHVLYIISQRASGELKDMSANMLSDAKKILEIEYSSAGRHCFDLMLSVMEDTIIECMAVQDRFDIEAKAVADAMVSAIEESLNK